MKALIFNSGIGKRMGELTHNTHKSLVKLKNGETIFERQIRILRECGIREIVVTTGPFADQLIAITQKPSYCDMQFYFVQNELYEKTNYIYSFYLARNYLDDDFLTLHGDLVFNKKLVVDLLKNENKSACLINKNLPLPEKDFKGRVSDGKLREVGINIFDKDCYTFQPMYKLSKKDLKIWIESVVDFIENRKSASVYAENAFNEVSDKMNVIPVSYEGYYINEIDNPEDYANVSAGIELVDYREQEHYDSVEKLSDILKEYNMTKPLVVLDKFLMDSSIRDKLAKITLPVFFTDFQPNPLYEDTVKGVVLFKENSCDGIISIGGGSAIDSAKAIKLFLPLSDKINYLQQEHCYINLKHIAIPTTAGTGSESTRYSVIYYKGEKQSLTDNMMLPDVAILDKSFLDTLPVDQKKATVFDALCHGIESMWSVNATDESRTYATQAISIILENIESYLNGDSLVNQKIMIAANLAGKAINISQTTAAHAMSYKLTSLYHIPHGQAVAICLPQVWEYLVNNYKFQSNTELLNDILRRLNKLFKADNSVDAMLSYKKLLKQFDMYPKIDLSNDVEKLAKSVNTTRLKNYPATLSEDDLIKMYNDLSNGR